jgi:hypothetical protein
MMMEPIRPSVMIDGQTYYPPGWMYILAYAINGFEWAIKECEKPEFKAQVKAYLIEKISEEVGSMVEKHTRTTNP